MPYQAAGCQLGGQARVDKLYLHPMRPQVRGENLEDFLRHLPPPESWYLIHLCCNQLLLAVLPRLCAPTMLVSADNGPDQSWHIRCLHLLPSAEIPAPHTTA